MIQSINIDFTSQALPAPYAQKCTISITMHEAELNVKVSLEYLDRENLTQEEIWEEGFSGDDDFHWEGSVMKTWINYLEEASNLGDTGPSAPPGETIQVTIDSEHGQTQIKNKKRWIYIMQEVLQSIYETAELEAPLRLRFKINEEGEQNLQVSFVYSFKNLEVKIEISQTGHSTILYGDWQLCSQLMREIFIPDYLTEKASEETAIPGTYIDPGDGLWYDTGQAVKIGKKAFTPVKIKKLIEDIVGIQ